MRNISHAQFAHRREDKYIFLHSCSFVTYGAFFFKCGKNVKKAKGRKLSLAIHCESIECRTELSVTKIRSIWTLSQEVRTDNNRRRINQSSIHVFIALLNGTAGARSLPCSTAAAGAGSRSEFRGGTFVSLQIIVGTGCESRAHGL